jgi:YebC/PmpR family DNA-binding regulatory protein
MAGHSKWANIKHRKAAQDAKRGKLFTKLIREITVAAKEGGGDAESNPRLRTAIDKALAANMTRDTVERAIKRGCGAQDAENYEALTYEGYGQSGVAVLVECLTDNRNRTVSEVRHAFSKTGGNLGTDGSVAYLFNRRGVIGFEAGADEERILEVALEAGAQDVSNNPDGSIDVWTALEDFHKVADAFKRAGLAFASAELTMQAATEVTLEQEEAEKILKLVDMLEDLDDVQNVYTNADFSEEVMANLSQG